jgi:hypothetical protein
MSKRDERIKLLHGLPEKTKLTKSRAVRRAGYIIRQSVDCGRPVKIRLVHPSHDAHLRRLHAVGYTHLVNRDKPRKEQYFLIVIDQNQSVDNILDLIIHEWAHVLTWDHPESKDHGNAWSRAYGQLYRLIIED